MAVPPKSPPNHQPPPSAHPAPTAPPSAADPAHPAAPSAAPSAAPAKVDVSQLTLSYTTGVSIARLETAHQEVDAWSENLEKSLQEDVDNGALKVEEAAAVAAKYDVAAPKAKSQEPEAKATTPEMNQAAMDAGHKG